MNYEPKTIADHIECLARLTGAPQSFIRQVRELFSRKGIGLDTDATPFLAALEEAFRREESIRCSTHRARQNLSKMQNNFQKIGQAYVQQLSQLKRMQSSLRNPSRRLDRKPAQGDSDALQVTIRGDHRTLVTRPVREELPMVPGPEDIQ